MVILPLSWGPESGSFKKQFLRELLEGLTGVATAAPALKNSPSLSGKRAEGPGRGRTKEGDPSRPAARPGPLAGPACVGGPGF